MARRNGKNIKQSQEKMESKTRYCSRMISKNMRNGKQWNNERLVIFTEYKDTIKYLTKIFEKSGFSKQILILTGRYEGKDRELIKQAFESHPDINPVRILPATDAISEGIDLQNVVKSYPLGFHGTQIDGTKKWKN
ncbi:MAG: helicase-related protein [Candidatus Nitrosocosmicus sp.]|nr:helicase-related protein [Candidatus Nitrosocosmicus sp.]